MSDFDYGKKRNGQYERHPSEVKKEFVAPIRNAYKHTTCGVVTSMRQEDLCLTYATNPKYYGSTFCAGCKDYFPVHQFTWLEQNKDTTFILGQTDGEPGKDLRSYDP